MLNGGAGFSLSDGGKQGKETGLKKTGGGWVLIRESALRILQRTTKEGVDVQSLAQGKRAVGKSHSNGLGLGEEVKYSNGEESCAGLT